MLEDIKRDTRVRMNKSLEALTRELAKIRTGRAHPSLLEHVQVEAHGPPRTRVSGATVASSARMASAGSSEMSSPRWPPLT